MKCPTCGRWNIDPVSSCPGCGANLAEREAPATLGSARESVVDRESAAWIRDRMRRKGREQFAAGAVVFALAAGFSLLSYLSAASDEHGGSYRIAVGAVLFGLYAMFRGWSRMRDAEH